MSEPLVRFYPTKSTHWLLTFKLKKEKNTLSGPIIVEIVAKITIMRRKNRKTEHEGHTVNVSSSLHTN